MLLIARHTRVYIDSEYQGWLDARQYKQTDKI